MAAACLQRYLTAPPMVVLIATVMCTLSYADKTLIPSSFQSVTAFLRTEFNTNNVDTPFGALNSVFIVGFALSGLFNGYALRWVSNPFTLLAISSAVFAAAIALSGLAPNYWVLLLARMMSGAGEAAVFVLMPPYFLQILPQHLVGKTIAVFYMGMPLGLAGGAVYASQISTKHGWRDAFLWELFIVVPMVCLLFLIAWAHTRQAAANASKVVPMALEVNDADVHQKRSGCSVVRAYIRVFKGLPVYWLIVFGYAGYIAVFAGIAAFGGTFVVALGIVDSQDKAALGLGSIIAGAGIIGSLLGGHLVDKRHATGRHHTSDEGVDIQDVAVEPSDVFALTHALRVMTIFISGATVCMLGGAACVNLHTGAAVGFFVLLAIGIILLLGQVSATQVAIMTSVPVSMRPVAMGMSLVIMHFFGDVPSAPIIGMVADALSPTYNCNDATPPQCDRSVSGMQDTLFAVYAWLAWPMLLWGISWALAYRMMQKEGLSDRSTGAYGINGDDTSSHVVEEGLSASLLDKQ